MGLAPYSSLEGVKPGRLGYGPGQPACPPLQGCSPTSVCEEDDDKQRDAQCPEPPAGPEGNAHAHLHGLAQSCPCETAVSRIPARSTPPPGPPPPDLRDDHIYTPSVFSWSDLEHLSPQPTSGAGERR